jgi:transcriptional regulator with XRE-family HTH domain
MNEKIKILLSRKDWTQKRLADELSVSKRTVASWVSDNERDRRTPNKWVSKDIEHILTREGI